MHKIIEKHSFFAFFCKINKVTRPNIYNNWPINRLRDDDIECELEVFITIVKCKQMISYQWDSNCEAFCLWHGKEHRTLSRFSDLYIYLRLCIFITRINHASFLFIYARMKLTMKIESIISIMIIAFKLKLWFAFFSFFQFKFIYKKRISTFFAILKKNLFWMLISPLTSSIYLSCSQLKCMHTICLV